MFLGKRRLGTKKRRSPGSTRGNTSKCSPPAGRTYSCARNRRHTPQPWWSAPLRQQRPCQTPGRPAADPGSWGQPPRHDRQQFLLLRETRGPGGHQPPPQRQGASPPPDTDIQNVKGAPLRAIQAQVQSGAAGHQPAQNTLGQGLVVRIDAHAFVLEEALHALLEAVAGAGQGQGRDNPVPPAGCLLHKMPRATAAKLTSRVGGS